MPQLTQSAIAPAPNAVGGSRVADKPQTPGRPARYILKDLGTFGGPSSYIQPDGTTIFENRSGTVVGAADTSNSDPYASQENALFPVPPDGYIQHAFLWRKGKLSDLGALPGTTISYAASVSANDLAAGISTNGVVDPLTNLIEGRAVFWGRDGLRNLGTLGGRESYSFAVNSRGDVVGAASNSMPNSYSYFGWGAQTRAFRWAHGEMKDLGTLGGSNAIALYVNESGQIAGLSDTSTMVNPKTGIPPMHPFLWEPRLNHGTGRMIDAGTIGGTIVNSIGGINERGEFIGQMSLADEQKFHAFKWNGSRLVDLGTFGGPNSNAFAVNGAGSIAGEADSPSGCSGPAQRGVLWRHGAKIDLGVIRGTAESVGNGINAGDQIVGYSFTCDRSSATAFLSEKGHLYDLNSLIAPTSLYVYYALEINDRGEISGDGILNGENHAVVLVPCSDGNRGCGVAGNPRPVALPPRARQAFMRLSSPYHIHWLAQGRSY
ncbi:MAG: hypothetical protein JOY77_07390 [Alphaproteobacteria bacterium]|nr:hypothetical protein [Alphaproteobacteria bacterium]MBV9700716.1 hypothetical protein [Candidatus Eremiobacteraeota bacterium]